MAKHEQKMLDTFVDLADTLVGDYDVNEFLRILVERSADLLEVTTAGVMLESSAGHLQLAVALTPEMEALEQAEIDNAEGPCHEAYRSGEPVVANDLEHSEVAERWPTVIGQMLNLGLRAAYAFPLRLRDDRIGALNLYRDRTGDFDDDDIRLGQAFADAAAIGILQERKVANAERRAEHLQHALDSRIVIEQAKGIISNERAISIDDAFDAIRTFARSNNCKVHDVALTVIDCGADALE
jgi:GAF domain-containing protein